MLAEERRRRLLDAMAQAGIAEMVLYGNAWQADYLRYAADFGILEGHGIAVVSADGTTELFLDSATEAERAEAEVPGATIHIATDIARAVGARLDRVANHRIAAAPRRFVPNWLAQKSRSFALEDGTALIDTLLMHKLPGEIAVLRRAAQMADDAYAVFRQAVTPGRRQYELVADIEAYLRSRGCPDNFMIIGSGGKDVLGMTPPSERSIMPGDLVTTELTPALEGYFVQICRTLVVGKANDAQRRAFDIFREALEAGIAAVRPGATAGDVARAENDVFRKYGLGDYTTSKWTRVRGHGLGLFCDSKPHLLEDVETPLVPGMALIVHPNTYHPEAGYLVLGDALVVTERGAEVLCRTPRELFEVAA
ncbi:MAG TPA: Xaa-Pro peptidase family protein [Xanthobacteraceae bacterium]|nr:Xaa-Pro peptidase family protein [Xanthobacteraceae bacterium]